MASSGTGLQGTDVTEEFKERFEKLLASKNSEPEIWEFLNFYRNNKDRISRQEVDRVIWTDLPHFCFQRQIENSDIPVTILNCINHLPSRIIPNIAIFLLISACKYETLSEVEVRSRSAAGLRTFCYLSYFLHHSNYAKATFNGSRITEILLDADPSPFINIIVFSDPLCVLTLLQYGARFYLRGHDEESSVHPIFICALEFLISYGIHTGHWSEPDLRLLIRPDEFLRDIVNTREVFKIFLRSTTNPHTVTCLVAGRVSRPGRRPVPQLHVLRSFYEAIFPGMNLGYKQPPSLKRISRDVIRHLLHENWQLPDGIFELDIPVILLRYINLEED